MICDGLQLPEGYIYLNEISPKNNVMNTDISDYGEFVLECSRLFKDYKEVEKIIYKDEDTSFILTKQEFDKINKILEVSKDYGVNFYSDFPFENFGSDDESDYMCSFSKYYEEILSDAFIDFIETSEFSGGKYIMDIHLKNGNKFGVDLRTWENLENVIDKIKRIEEEIIKEKLIVIWEL